MDDLKERMNLAQEFIDGMAGAQSESCDHRPQEFPYCIKCGEKASCLWPIEQAGAQVLPFNVFEVYSKRADRQGWDFIVYKSAQATLQELDFDLDELEDGEEIRIVFKRYTQEQMDEVIYE